MIKQTFSIKGMSCGSCVAKIEEALNGAEGVISAAVDFAEEKVTVEYDSDKIDVAQMQKIVEDRGGFQLVAE